MILSRSKPAIGGASTNANVAKASKERKTVSTLEEFLEKRDFIGALTLLEFNRKNVGGKSLEDDLWVAYAAFHLADYKKAMEEYQKSLKKENCPPEVWTYLGCCLFFLGMYKEAEGAALKGPASRLQNRLLFHLYNKFNDEQRLMKHHSQLQPTPEDQLSLASIHYLRSHFQEAIDVHKRLLLENKDFAALNCYVALCYYKLDFYDVSQEVLAVYLQRYPDSVIALNLRACNHYRLFDGKAAEAELKALKDVPFAQDLIKHNTVVFRGGQGALQVLPPLIDVIPEARLNLVIYHMKYDEVDAAYELVKDIEPNSPHEYILKGVVNVAIGQQQNSKDHLKIAQQYFQIVGTSASECDTIPGRQCMASCFFILRQFEDVLLYFNSIKSYFHNDDSFNYNFAQVKASLGNYKEAEEFLNMVQSDKIRSSYVFISWLAKCYIMNKKARQAWELYLKMESSTEQYNLLGLIANDCYKMGLFYYSAKAFDVLERLDPNPEYWEAKRGACIGVFQMIIANREPQESLRDVIQMLKASSQPQTEYIIRVMQKWAKDNAFNVPM